MSPSRQNIKQYRIVLPGMLTLCVLLSGCAMPRGATPAHDRTLPPVPAVTFVDVTEQAGIRFQYVNGAFGEKWLPETMGGGGGFLDYDADGWLDILLINGDYWPGHAPPGARRPTLALYRNRRDGTFEDVTARAGLSVSLYGMGLAVGDFDNDGWDDLFITAVGRSRLFRNVSDGRGGRRFVDVTERFRLNDRGWSTSAAWVDFDRDGDLDLFVCHYVRWTPETDLPYTIDGVHKSYARPQAYNGEPCRLYRNDGNRFTDVSAKSGVLRTGKSLGVVVVDYDGDNWPDIFVANDTEPNFLFHNQGDGTFLDIGMEAGIALSDQGTSRAGMGIDAADVLNRGQFDILITNFAGEQVALYRRAPEGSGLFLDVAAQAGVGVPSQRYLGFGAFFFDYDLDGWPDIFVANGHIHDDIEGRELGVTYEEPCLLFRNLGQGRFMDVSALSGPALTVRRVGRAAACGDYDNDGDLDVLVVSNRGRPALMRNDNRTGNGWIRLALRGKTSNRNAIGARVRVTAGGVTQTQEVRSGGSYLAASDRRLLFGLGRALRVDSVEIRWPGGRVQPVPPPQRNTALVVTEGN
ncbi:MAG: CRTAC1 family protein [Chloroherpetonaceae bacterium]|nr:CRTAC1 family protein [Chthonomonadaceae bacterium]MDW8206477.1 CRTAC1 family protein [Chloroherpetonaceae bacterium]